MLKPVAGIVLTWRRLPRWARIALALTGGMVVLVAALWVVLLASARWTVHRELARIRAKGEPATARELVPPPVPDEENAAVILEEACRKLEAGIPKVPEHPRVTHRWGALPLEPWEWVPPELRAPVAELHCEVIDLVREALARPRCRSNSDYVNGPEGYHSDLGWAGRFPQLSCMMASAVAASILEGRGEEALQRIELSLGLARAFSDEPAGSAQQLACRTVEMCLFAVRRVVTSPSLPERTSRALIGCLQAVDFQRLLFRMMVSRRVFNLEDVNRFFEGNYPYFDAEPPPDIGVVRVFPFVADWQRARILRACTEAVEALRLPPWAAFASVQSTQNRIMHGRIRFAKLRAPLQGYDAYFCSFGRYHDYFGTWALRDATVLGLALGIYHSAHGEYPDSLTALVPEFLPELPPDPFTGKPFIYRRKGADDQGFIVYSVGANLTDDGGVFRYDDVVGALGYTEHDISWEQAPAPKEE